MKRFFSTLAAVIAAMLCPSSAADCVNKAEQPEDVSARRIFDDSR